jgi:hypothetical protein
MIKPEVFCHKERRSEAMIALIRSLEAICWLYNGTVVAIPKNQVNDDILDDLKYWNVKRKGLGQSSSKRRDMDFKKVPDQTKQVLKYYAY